MNRLHGVDVGNWYQTIDGRAFKIVSIDSKDETVEIQYADGQLEELDIDFWYDLQVMPIDTPSAIEASPLDLWQDGDYEPDRQTLSEVLGGFDFSDYSH